MIPLHLRISGFLSYRDPVELDFTGFDLACISGPNGAGKSTLLDAITWSLFGQARRRDDALINLQSDAAEVAFTFRYEDSDYRIQRSLRRGKAGVLELQARSTEQGDDGSAWKPLTERTARETQARIEQILRLDYETFVNASFFLQGKADSFAQQTPSRRKEVLGNILGMEVWESYKARTSDLRRQKEAELSTLVGRLGEIEAELAEEPQRTERLAQLEAELARLAAERKAQASTLESARKTHAVIDRQRLLLDEQRASLDRLRRDLGTLQTRLADRQRLRLESADLIARAAEIEAAFASWHALRDELLRLDTVARAFADHEKRRAPLLQEIAAEEARLSQERTQLLARRQQVEASLPSMTSLERELVQVRAAVATAESRIRDRDALQQRLTEARQRTAEMDAENRTLKPKMDELKARIDTLGAAEGAACPLCGQSLTKEHRQSTLRALRAEGKQYGDQYRLNSAEKTSLQKAIARWEADLQSMAAVDQERVEASARAAQIGERLDGISAQVAAWEAGGRLRLEELDPILAAGDFAAAHRRQLIKVDAELAQLGYDAAAHDRLRANEQALRPIEEDRQKLLAAQAALAPLQDEIGNLESQIAERGKAIAAQQATVDSMESELAVAATGLPDLAQVERLLFELQERENRLNQEVGAARQKVAVLANLRQRSGELVAARQSLAVSIGRHKTLEAAFGKDGVQSLLIEQALPELETHANEILDRLSDGRMSVHFETQSPYRDRKREDLKETLEIKISDGAGQRDYEMYSGGEAFRVNFAIRLALSQVLAGRKGARLQTLVIDEGFGSQDNQGRQRLIETINLVRHDFAKVLLITHLDELKDAFPTRIEVEKTERGSTLRIG